MRKLAAAFIAADIVLRMIPQAVRLAWEQYKHEDDIMRYIRNHPRMIEYHPPK